MHSLNTNRTRAVWGTYDLLLLLTKRVRAPTICTYLGSELEVTSNTAFFRD